MSQPIRQLAVALGLLSAVSVGHAGAEPKRPKITGIANFAAKVDNLEEARKFYKGVVGFEEAFTTTDPAVAGDLIAFKVNDRQFVEISPTLQGDEDRLIRIGFETADARGLRDYLASKGVEVPARVDTDANGNRSFVVRDPDGHAVQFVQYM
jgi:catechol 2,3-dioxygenase-like lactoylglutathione lyase family enzyme